MKLIINGKSVALIIFLCGILGIHAEVEGNNNDSEFDIVCGPRCVQFLLEYYKKLDEPLIKIVEEIQSPQLENGAKLERLENYLNERGIFTCALQISDIKRLHWDQPVLLFLKTPKSNVGHYIIWMTPDSPNELTVWDGLKGWRKENYQEITKNFTGIIILTSSNKISQSVNCLKYQIGRKEVVFSLSVGASMLLIGYGCTRFQYDRSHVRTETSNL